MVPLALTHNHVSHGRMIEALSSQLSYCGWLRNVGWCEAIVGLYLQLNRIIPGFLNGGATWILCIHRRTAESRVPWCFSEISLAHVHVHRTEAKHTNSPYDIYWNRHLSRANAFSDLALGPLSVAPEQERALESLERKHRKKVKTKTKRVQSRRRLKRKLSF